MRALPESYKYIEQCRSVISALDSGELAEMEIQWLVGSSDHLSSANTLTYAIGKIDVEEGPLPLAVKIDPGNTYRLQTELAAAAEMIELVPELVIKFPRFIGGIALQGSEIRHRVILTEDATNGGEFTIRPAILGDDTLSALDRAVSEEGGLYSVFDDDTLTRSTAFNVNGEERILDFHPSPFRFGYRRQNIERKREAFSFFRQVAEEFTLQMDGDSPLGASILEVMGYDFS